MKLVLRLIVTTVVVALGPLPPLFAQTAPEETTGRSITNIRGGLYRFQDGGEVSVFLVTSEGIVVVDPLSRATVTWLQAELKTRFPNQPVRYVILTSHAYQRARASSLFGRGVEVVGHARFAEERARAAQRLPEAVRALDTNQDGVLQSSEFATSSEAQWLSEQDQNRDGVVSPAEIYGTVTSPANTFQQQVTITVGGARVDLLPVPVGDAADMIVVVFPAERLAFAADVLPLHTVPTRIGPISPESLRRVEQLPVDTILTGRGEIATKADVTNFREYLEDLIAGVRAGFAAGQSLTDIQGSLTLDKYRQWTNFSVARPSNIAEVYGRYRRLETSLYAGGVYSIGSKGSCSLSECSIDGESSPGALAGIQYSLGSVVMGARLQVNRAATMRLPYYLAEIQQERAWIVAFPIGYTVYRSPRVLGTVEAGPAIQIAEVGETFLPSAPGSKPFFIESRSTHFAWVVGSTLSMPLSTRLALVVPVEVVRTGSSLIVKTRFTVGAGVRIGLHRGVGADQR